MHAFDWQTVHPVARMQFMALADALSLGYASRTVPVLFRAYEGYRSPADQQKAYDRKASKARPWQSAHQFGLAVDFVPFVNGRFSWPNPKDECWAFLRAHAAAHGLINAIEWDRPHVQHPVFDELRSLLAPRLSGVEA